MTSSELSTVETIEHALADAEPTWVTLPPIELDLSDSLRRALEHFDAGPTPAGTAATAWLQQSALAHYHLSRTRLYISGGVIAGYYSLANSTVEVSQRDRKKRLVLDTRLGTLPATLVTWLAKDYRAEFEGTLLMHHAFATARAATQTQAAVALALDPFDAQTTEMWMSRYGFRRSSGKNRRLWTPLFAID